MARSYKQIHKELIDVISTFEFDTTMPSVIGSIMDSIALQFHRQECQIEDLKEQLRMTSHAHLFPEDPPEEELEEGEKAGIKNNWTAEWRSE